LDSIQFDASVLRGIELPKLEPMTEVDFKSVDRLMQSIALLHSVGWYHNDIHANNVMVSGGIARIIDWGEAEEHPLDKVTDD
jgi:tRNA A-37 threonylcarbamoyl transferase component Bud32